MIKRLFTICLLSFLLVTVESAEAVSVSASISSKPAYILVLDTSGSMKPILPHLQSATIDFVSALPDSTPVHLATFHEKGKPILSGTLSDANRKVFRRALTSLHATGQWTHFSAAVEAIRSVEIDSSLHYKALIFTDQMGDPRPGFKDITINEIASHLPSNIEVFVISSAQVLSSIGTADSTGFIATASGATGVEVNLKSSRSIFERLKDIADRQNIAEAIRPRPQLPLQRMVLLSFGGLLLIAAPILLQMVRRKSFHDLAEARGWVVTLTNEEKDSLKYIVYPKQRLIVGSEGTIKVASELVYDHSLRFIPHSEAQINGKKAHRATSLTEGDRIAIENSIHLSVRQMEKSDGVA